MATGRIGVTPTLGVRWSKAPTGGTTSLSGLDDNSVSLVYSVGYEQVYRNGTLLSRGNDYTATDGTTITLIDATITGDIIEVFANELIPLTDAISKGQYNAKGALLSATAAATPGVLAVGANDTVLIADSTASTGLKWGTPAGGGMTLIETLALTSGSSVTSSTIAGTYTDLQVVFRGVLSNNGSAMDIRFNGDTGSNYFGGYIRNDNGTISGAVPSEITMINLNGATATSAGYRNVYYNELYIRRYSDSNYKSVFQTQYMGAYPGIYFRYGLWNNTAAITSLTIICNGGNFTAGNAYIYGVK